MGFINKHKVSNNIITSSKVNLYKDKFSIEETFKIPNRKNRQSLHEMKYAGEISSKVLKIVREKDNSKL